LKKFLACDRADERIIYVPVASRLIRRGFGTWYANGTGFGTQNDTQLESTVGCKPLIPQGLIG